MKTPALCRPGDRYGRAPGPSAGRALFTLTAETAGSRSNTVRSGFRRKPAPVRLFGVPHKKTERPAFSPTVSAPLRLRGKTAQPARPTSGRPGLAPLPES
jgi:hypothetical protein